MPLSAQYSSLADVDPSSYYSPGDFIPLTASGQTEELEDGLDLLVGHEELPMGTPGGRKEDLRRGALIDGARHERGGECDIIAPILLTFP